MYMFGAWRVGTYVRGERIRLGITNPVGTGEVWDMCRCLVYIGLGELSGPWSGKVWWCYV